MNKMRSSNSSLVQIEPTQPRGHERPPAIVHRRFDAPCVRARILHPAHALSERYNFDLNAIMRRNALPELPQDPNAFYPYREALRLLEAAGTAAGNRHFGLLIAEASGLSGLGDVGRFILGAATLNDAIQRAASYISSHSPQTSFRLRRENSMIVWAFVMPPGIRENRHQGYILALSLMCQVIRRVAGHSWMPNEVRIEQGRATSADLERHFGSNITYNSGQTAIVFSEHFLALPLIRGTPTPADGSLTGPMLRPQTGPDGTLEVIRALIRSFLANQAIGEIDIAHFGRVSLRSFQRELTRSGTSFAKLVESVRLERSRELLADRRLPLSDLAFELGYTEQANFTRAFKRWTGLTPSKFRQLATSGEARL